MNQNQRFYLLALLLQQVKGLIDSANIVIITEIFKFMEFFPSFKILGLVNIRYYQPSFKQRIRNCLLVKQLLGERALPLSAPSGAFLRPLTPHRLPGKCCQSGVGRFLKVLGDANLTPIRRTITANYQRVILFFTLPHAPPFRVISHLTCYMNTYFLIHLLLSQRGNEFLLQILFVVFRV